MNIENDFLTDFDLFGKVPELYYKGRSKKSSTFGIVLTVIYIVIYIAFLLYKLVRMIQRKDVTFYDSYTFKGIPSIKLTNNEFFGAFGMGMMADPQLYYLEVDFVSKELEDGQLKEKERTRLDTEICQLEWFGSEYQDIFADQPLQNYYCIKNVSGLVLEGYSNLERFSFFNVRFYPCNVTAKNGEPCYPDYYIEKFFNANLIECKLQDNDLNPEDYNNPILRRRVDMNSPVFKDLFQYVYSYIQIVIIETDEDITGLNFFTDHIRRQVYTRYDESFLIASPVLDGDIMETRGPVVNVTLQLAAKVLTEKRQYVQLIDVLGDVGGLMEIVYTFLNLISSFVTEILYDKSLVNNLFSFDLNKKYVVFNKAKNKIKRTNEDNNIKDLAKVDTINLQQKFQDLENNKNIEIFSKPNQEEKNTITKNEISITKKKVKKKRSQKNSIISKTSQIQLKEQNVPIINAQSNENKVLSDENKNILDIYNVSNAPLGNENDSNISNEKDLKTIYVNNWLICCFLCTSKKKNVNKIMFEEGSKLITSRLDILNMFNYLYVVEILQKKLGVEAKGKNMTDNCKNDLQIYNSNNGFKTIEN